MIVAVFNDGETDSFVGDVWQWDYGQTLRIEGLNLPTAVEIHFSLDKTGGEAVRRIGVSRDGITDVKIPDFVFGKEFEQGEEKNYKAYAFIYPSSPDSGETTHRITMRVTARPKPESFESPDNTDLFNEAVLQAGQAIARAETAEKSAEAWAHGHEAYPERDKDNAAFYAGQAKEAAAGIPGQVVEAKKEIDSYVDQKQTELRGETGNVYFAAFKVVKGRLKMYSDPTVDRVRFVRKGSRLSYRLAF